MTTVSVNVVVTLVVFLSVRMITSQISQTVRVERIVNVSWMTISTKLSSMIHFSRLSMSKFWVRLAHAKRYTFGYQQSRAGWDDNDWPIRWADIKFRQTVYFMSGNLVDLGDKTFTFGKDTTAYFACSVILGGRMLVLGGSGKTDRVFAVIVSFKV